MAGGAAWTPPTWKVALVSLAYLGVEIWFHYALLDAASSPDTPREALEDLADAGKVIAAFGLAWAVLGKGGLLRLAAYGVGFWLLLLALHAAILASLSDAAKIEAWDLAVYRMSLASGEIDDPSLPVEGAARKAALANVALLSLDEGFSARAALWGESERREAAAAARRKVSEGWSAYSKASGAVVEAHGRFKAESRKFMGYWHQSHFKTRTGMMPNPDISLEDFLREIRWSKLPERGEISGWETRDLFRLPDGRVVRGGDVGLGLSRRQFEDKVGGMAEESLSRAFPSDDARLTNPDAGLVATVVWVPPLAAAFSMIGVVANAGLLFGIAVGRITRSRLLARAGMPIPLAVFAAFLWAMPQQGDDVATDVWGRAVAAQERGLLLKESSIGFASERASEIAGGEPPRWLREKAEAARPVIDSIERTLKGR